MAENIYTSRKLRRTFFGFKVERPQAAPGKVLVLTGGGAPIVLRPGQKPTAGEAAWNRYDTVIELDTSKRPLDIKTAVPAKGGAFSFQLVFTANYQVSDPVRVLDEGLTNPEPTIKRVLVESISRVTEMYEVNDRQNAMTTIREMIDKARFTTKLPFEVCDYNVNLELDEAATKFASEQRKIVQDAQLAETRRQFVDANAKLQELTQRLDRDERRREEEFTIEMESSRRERFLSMMSAGRWAMLAQWLAQNPDDIQLVTNMFVQMQDKQLASYSELLATALREDRLDDRQLKPILASLLHTMESNLSSGPMSLLSSQPQQLADRSEE